MNARLRTLVLTAIASCGLTMGAPYAHASNAAQNDFEVFMQKIRNSVKRTRRSTATSRSLKMTARLQMWTTPIRP